MMMPDGSVPEVCLEGFVMQDARMPSESSTLPPPILPDQLPLFRHLDPAAALAFRTPLQEHPPAADTKAAALITGLGIMFPILARTSNHLATWLGQIGQPSLTGAWLGSVVLWGLGSGFVILSLATLVQAFRTLWPRFPTLPPSLAFFGNIAALDRDTYIASVVALSHEAALEQMLIYNHNLSIICVEKFRQLQRGITCFKGSFACWLVLIVILAVRDRLA